MQFKEIITNVCDYLKIADQKMDAEGRFIIVFDNELVLELTMTAPGDLLLIGLIKDLTKEEVSDKELRRLLYWSTNWMMKNPEVLSFDNKRNWIILTRTISRKSLNIKNILESLEGFLNNMDLWLTALKENKESSSFLPNPQSIFLKP